MLSNLHTRIALAILLLGPLTARIHAAPPAPPPTDLAQITKEPNPERRADLAFAYANGKLDQAKADYSGKGPESLQGNLHDLHAAAELVNSSLAATGADPHKSRAHKKAEVSFRQLLRRLTGLAESVGFQERPMVEQLRDEVSDMHDRLLSAIMEKKKK